MRQARGGRAGEEGKGRKKWKNVEMHEDAEGSSGREDYTVSPLSNKPIWKHQIKIKKEKKMF